MWLFLLAFSIYTFLFFVHKHSHQGDNSLKLDSSFLNMFKYVGLLFLIILLPLLAISYLLQLHKTDNSFFNITQSILGITIIIIVLAIIAKLFSIKPSNTKECSLQDEDRIKYLMCLFKNIIFFIPCLLVILADEINKDIKLTPSSVYLLFLLGEVI